MYCTGIKILKLDLKQCCNIQIFSLAPEKIPFKVVTPKNRFPPDSLASFVTRNFQRPKPLVKPNSIRLMQATIKTRQLPRTTIVNEPISKTSAHQPPYRMTASLKLALEDIDMGNSYTKVAEAYQISEVRLRRIKQLEIENPDLLKYRK